MTPAPRPWMPLLRHRFEVGYTSVPRTRRLARWDEAGLPRFVSPTAALNRRRSRFRRAPAGGDFRLRLDELAAEARVWVAGLTNDASDASGQEASLDRKDR